VVEGVAHMLIVLVSYIYTAKLVTSFTLPVTFFHFFSGAGLTQEPRCF
jgi:hypothetical protein